MMIRTVCDERSKFSPLWDFRPGTYSYQEEMERLGRYMDSTLQSSRQLTAADDLHTICSMMADGELGWAPVHAPRTVLDLGCGTGNCFPGCVAVSMSLSYLRRCRNVDDRVRYVCLPP